MKKKILIFLSVLILTFASCITCFAASSYDSIFDNDTYAVIFKQPDDSIVAYSVLGKLSTGSYECVVPSDVSVFQYSTSTLTGSLEKVTFFDYGKSYDSYRVMKYKWENSSWSLSYSEDCSIFRDGQILADFDLPLASSVLNSSYDVYDANNDLVFPEAPLEALPVKLVDQNKGELLQTLGGAMKILVLCGVGLIASLAALNLFGKVFSTFQVKS